MFPSIRSVLLLVGLLVTSPVWADTPLPESGSRALGGEEFALVLVEVDAENALKVLERLRQELAEARVYHGGVELSFTISAGVASWSPGSSLSGEEIMYQADQALYRAKKQGRNRICVYDPAPNADTDLTRSINPHG